MIKLGLALTVSGLALQLVTLDFGMKGLREVVDFQFQNHNAAWVADRRPVGGELPESSITLIESDLATISCAISWAISRPSWLPQGSTTDKFRIHMIRWFLVSLIGFSSVVVGIVLFACNTTGIATSEYRQT